MRLALAPAVVILKARFISMAVELKQILVVQAAMPAALGLIFHARMYQERPAVAVQVVVAKTVVLLFTLSYIITYGIRYLELTPLSP